MTAAADLHAHPEADPATREVRSIGHHVMSGTTYHAVIAPGGGVRIAPVAADRLRGPHPGVKR